MSEKNQRALIYQHAKNTTLAIIFHSEKNDVLDISCQIISTKEFSFILKSFF